ncbi:MAG: iron ABC transporter permease [Pseudomonadota bacterium]
MRVTPIRLAVVLTVLAVALAMSLLAGLTLGAVKIPPGQVWDWVLGRAPDGPAGVILARFRWPRLALAGFIGAALGMSGVVFQGVLRNPLAEPFILGVSGGAAAGAVLGLAAGISGTLPLAGLAFLGSLSTTVLVLGLSRRGGDLDVSTLLLTGVMVNAFFSSVIMFVVSISEGEKIHAIMFWLYGDLGAAALDQTRLLAPLALASGILMFLYSRQLNLLGAGDLAAAALGVKVERTKLVLFLTVSVLCGAAVSLGGLIGFVGLIVPHIVRLTLGHDHRLLLPAAGMFGAVFLILADTAARVVLSPAQLPVGVVTAFLGAPFFLLLLSRKSGRWW